MFEPPRQYCCRNTRKCHALFGGLVLVVPQAKHFLAVAIATPDFGYAELLILRELVDRGIRDVDFNHQIGRWVRGRIYTFLITDAPFSSIRAKDSE